MLFSQSYAGLDGSVMAAGVLTLSLSAKLLDESFGQKEMQQ
jgi:hypothetical protein